VVIGAVGLFSTAALLAGCPGTLTDEEKAKFTGGGTTFECEEIGPYLTKKCGTAGCHGATTPASNLDLVSPGVEQRIANKTAMCGGLLANTNDPQSSSIYTKLLDPPPCGARMPFLQEKLPDEEIDCVLTWLEGIEGGGPVEMDAGGGGSGGSGGAGGAGGN
jgi:hypothetical protein